MELLTGKAFEAFKEWFNINYCDNCVCYRTKNIIIYSIIIEWFDSVGIYIEVNKNNSNVLVNGFNSHVVKSLNGYYKTALNTKSREEAIKYAIEKANKIYNNKNSL